VIAATAMHTVPLDAGRNIVSVSLFDDRFGKTCTKRDLSLDDLGALIRKPRRRSKAELPLLKLATFGDKPTDKGALRNDANIVTVAGVELDYDAEQLPVEKVIENLRAAKVLSVVYTSASHTPDKPRFRILAPFLRPVSGSPARMAEARRNALQALQLASGATATAESFTASQAYFYGQVIGAHEVEVEIVPGHYLDTLIAPASTKHTPATPPSMTPSTGSPLPPAERLQKLRAGDELHPTACSLAMRYASRGLGIDEIIQIMRAQIEQAERDPARITEMLQGGELRRIAESAVRKAQAPVAVPAPPRPRIELRPIGEVVAERREPRWIQHEVIEHGVLAVLAGQRSTFKSFVALDWSMRAALAGHPVIILSAEGAGIGNRADAWMRVNGGDRKLDDLPLRVYERPLRLTAGGDLAELIEVIDATPPTPKLVVIDTMSKFSAGLDENDNAEVAQYLGDLAVGLRDRFDSTVLLVAHAGHGDAKRPRGASALMANPDAEYIVERPAPTAMTITVSRERFKDYAALPPLAYTAEVIDLGRADSYNNRVTSLVLQASTAPMVLPRAVGANQNAAVRALLAFARHKPDQTSITSMELRALLTDHGIDRRRRPAVIDFLVNCRALTPSIGGHTFDPSVLR
jgi:hypothetical protein